MRIGGGFAIYGGDFRGSEIFFILSTGDFIRKYSNHTKRVIQELYAYLHYGHSEEQLSYWRTYTGLEVDAVIGDARVAIEIKAVAEVSNKHLKGLKAFGEEYPQSRRIVVSFDRINRKIGDIECLHIKDFLPQLWSGEVI